MSKVLSYGGSLLRFGGGALIGAVFALPFIWMGLTSLKAYPETLVFPPKWLPEKPMWDNFAAAWGSGPFPTYLANSLIVTLGILALQFLTIIPAAYAFSRYRFTGKNALFALSLITLMIPSQLIFLPVYLLFSSWGLVNTLVALTLPFASSALGIFLLRQAFNTVPDELLEAARLDHASEWRIIRKLMVPMAKPTLATFALISFITHWNEYFWPLVMTSSKTVRTLPLGVATLRDGDGTVYWNILMAGNVILAAPIIIVFLVARRHIIKAFVYFGIK